MDSSSAKAFDASRLGGVGGTEPFKTTNGVECYDDWQREEQMGESRRDVRLCRGDRSRELGAVGRVGRHID